MAAGIEWVAAADSPDAFARSTDRSVLLHRLDEVAAAGRMEAALLPDNWTQKDLIQPDHADQNSAGQVHQQFPHN